MLKGLAQAGANVVMHGLLPADEAAARCQGFEKEYGVKVGHSAADVTQPQAIRYVVPLCSEQQQLSKSIS